MKTRNISLSILLLLLVITPSLFAQPYTPYDEESRLVRIAWRGDEHALRYQIEIQKMEYEYYQYYLREFTASLYINIPLQLGEYRFRIIPHDILDRPGEGTQWVHFEVRSDVIEFFDIEDDLFQVTYAGEDAAVIDKRRFNTIGIAVGYSYDPLLMITLHGTFSPMRNIFIELGCDVGFISRYGNRDVDGYYSIYPYINLGYFMPFRERGGVFAGAGIGYMTGRYTFEFGDASINVFAVNIKAGVNLFDFFNITYTLRTDFSSPNSKIALGLVYRFR
ncbi:MAG: porin family protein [Spirochaetaceae bacterium]|nr:porin family protein [Spirochaetaceae bacterium]